MSERERETGVLRDVCLHLGQLEFDGVWVHLHHLTVKGEDLGFRVWGFGLWDWGVEFEVWGLVFGV